MFGQMLLKAFYIFIIMYIIGFAIEKFVLSRDLGRVGDTIVNLLFFVGVIVHEASHRVMCIMTGAPAHNMRVNFRNKYGSTSPGGSISLRQPFQLTFIQGLLICFGPLIIGAWLIYLFLVVAFNPFFDPIIRVISGFLCVSILLAITPSKADLSKIKFSWQNDPSHSLYQTLLLLISFLLVWWIVGAYNLVFPLELYYYPPIIIVYIIFKYSFIGLRVLINKIQFRKGVPRSAAGWRRFARRGYKPKRAYTYEDV
jgi:hypothetical protein